ncbi:MAG: TauD/TfdA family dioxygenase [Bdellovibrionales bacterium]|nr:TauD/TfdA family dioxygenase [Bdellovibrionales bacterium]
MAITGAKIGSVGCLIEARSLRQSLESLDLSELRDLFDREHLLVLRGFCNFASPEEFAQYCELWGEISMWPFGKVLELVEQQEPADHIFDSNYVPLHWDGMYRPEVPEIQIFHCVSSPGKDQGGCTTFSNTALAYERAAEGERKAWARVTGVYERKMEFYHSKTVAPVVTPHPSKGFKVIRYCEPPKAGDSAFINHPVYSFEGIQDADVPTLVTSLKRALYAPENFYAHEWQTGDVVISDNYTLLHGREAFVSGAPRHLRRVHVLGKPALKNPHLEFHR